MKTCKDCKWWEFRDRQLEMGYCRRHSPCCVLHTDDEEAVNKAHRTKWPWTSNDDWCGEFQEKEQ